MAAQQPTYQAYTVVKREGQDDFWLNYRRRVHAPGRRRLQRGPASASHQRQDRVATTQGADRGASGQGDRAAPRTPATNNCSLNFQARQQCLRPKLSPATHVRGIFSYHFRAYIRCQRYRAAFSAPVKEANDDR